MGRRAWLFTFDKERILGRLISYGISSAIVSWNLVHFRYLSLTWYKYSVCVCVRIIYPDPSQ
jgi:hypothetical protein